MKNIIRNFKSPLLASLIFISVLFIQEFVLRFVLPDFNPNHHIRFNKATDTSPALGVQNATFRLVKNSGDYNVTVRFNEHGFRDTKNIKEARIDDWILVGDSFSMGWGVEQSQRVSEFLEKRISRKVYNISIPTDINGYKALIKYAESRGAKIRNVIVAVNMQNDLANYGVGAKTPPKIKALSKQEETPLLQPIKNYLIKNSCFYFSMTSIISQNKFLRKIALKTGLMVSLDQIPRRQINNSTIRSTVKSLKSMTNRYKLIVLVVPTRAIWIGKNLEEEKKIHEMFLSELKKQKIDFIDMRKYQEQNKKPMSYHFKNDGHWTPKGHLLAASAISAKFFSNNRP